MTLIMAAPNGARKGHADHPRLPVTLPETVETARACHAAGARALHLHVRDAAGGHSLDAGLYREALAELAQAVPGMRVQVTTEAVGRYDMQAQAALLAELRPAWASLALREAARDRGVARRIHDTARDVGTEIQHIVFDADDARLLAEWQDAGVLGPDASVILVLGRYDDGPPSDPAALPPLLDSLPPVGRWMVCAFGPSEHACLRAAARLGGDLRVGFENATQQEDGTVWPDMAASVRALRHAIEENLP